MFKIRNMPLRQTEQMWHTTLSVQRVPSDPGHDCAGTGGAGPAGKQMVQGRRVDWPEVRGWSMRWLWMRTRSGTAAFTHGGLAALANGVLAAFTHGGLAALANGGTAALALSASALLMVSCATSSSGPTSSSGADHHGHMCCKSCAHGGQCHKDSKETLPMRKGMGRQHGHHRQGEEQAVEEGTPQDSAMGRPRAGASAPAGHWQSGTQPGTQPGIQPEMPPETQPPARWRSPSYR